MNKKKKRKLIIVAVICFFCNLNLWRKNNELDRQKNCTFRSIENKKIRKVIEMLSLGYVPPFKFQLSPTLLNEIHTFKGEKSKGFNILSWLFMCKSLNWWSNINKEPIICIVLTAIESRYVANLVIMVKFGFGRFYYRIKFVKRVKTQFARKKYPLVDMEIKLWKNNQIGTMYWFVVGIPATLDA